MSRVAFTLGGSPGERASMWLLVLLVAVELLFDFSGRPAATPTMDVDVCYAVCGSQVAKVGAYECECAPWTQPRDTP